LAVGYAQGVQSGTNLPRYSVREKDSHAWPEVFFPGFGWIPFEPTTAITSIDYTGAGGAGALGGPTGQTGGAATPRPLGRLTGEDRAQALLDSLDTGETTPIVTRELSLFAKILVGVGIAALLMGITLLVLYLRRNRNAIRTQIARQWRGFYHFSPGCPGGRFIPSNEFEPGTARISIH